RISGRAGVILGGCLPIRVCPGQVAATWLIPPEAGPAEKWPIQNAGIPCQKAFSRTCAVLEEDFPWPPVSGTPVTSRKISFLALRSRAVSLSAMHTNSTESLNTLLRTNR